MINNYFKVAVYGAPRFPGQAQTVVSEVFPFDDRDDDSAETAYDTANAYRAVFGGRLSVWRPTFGAVLARIGDLEARPS